MKYDRVILISIDSLGRRYSKYFEKYFNIKYKNYLTTNSWTLPSHLTMLTSTTFPDLYFTPKIQDVPKHKNYIPNIPTVAAYFRGIGFKSQAITGGGYMSKFFGWGKDWDIWEEPDSNGSVWNGEEIIPGKKTLLFLHTYYVHNWFEDDNSLRGLIKTIWKETQKNRSSASNFDLDIQKKIIKGKKLYVERVKKIAKRLEWINKLDEKTLVILTSDHAELFLEDKKSFNHGNLAIYSQDIFKVPLLIKDCDYGIKPVKKEERFLYDFYLLSLLLEKTGIKFKNFIQQSSLGKFDFATNKPSAYTQALEQELIIIKASKIYRQAQYYYKFRDKILNRFKRIKT